MDRLRPGHQQKYRPGNCATLSRKGQFNVDGYATERQKGCIFCDFVNRNASGHLIYEDRHVAGLLSLEGHPLIVPKPHFADVFELDEIHAAAVMQAAVRVAKATKIATQCDGINLVQSNGAAAGQDVFHFHLHIKPRFQHDDVKMSWDARAIDDEIRTKTSAAITQQLDKFL